MSEKKYLDESGVSRLISKIKTLFAPLSHTHTKSQITDFPSAMKNPSALTFTGGVSETYDGSSSKVVEIPTTMKGATTTSDGASGLVTTPPKGNSNRYLRSDGTWSVPPDTNTTYSNATTSSSGLMSSSDKSKLDGIATGANKYIHPDYTAKTNGLYKVTVDSKGHISETTAVTKADITALGIPGQDTNTTYSTGTTSTSGLTKLYDAVGENTDGAMTQDAITKSLSGKAALGHDHNISDVTGLQNSLDSKALKSHSHAIANVTNLQNTLDGKSNTGHTHDDRYYTETEINTKLATKSDTSHKHAASDITSGTLSADRLPSIPVSKLSGVIAAANLPSYVDDVLEYAGVANFPETGESGKIYVDTDYDITYRWGGSGYVEISKSLALGTTSSTAYRGDLGQIAYVHSQTTSGNPHKVTKSDVGLGNVDNTADVNKSVKYATSAGSSTTATTATALSTSAGSATQPIYFSNGKPAACSYTINASVPSGAKFTDTWRGIQNNLTSTSTSDSLSAAQGKVLNDKFASYVPTSRTVNGKALSSNISLSASDVGASASGHNHDHILETVSSSSVPSKAADGTIEFYYNVNNGLANNMPSSNNANAIISLSRHAGDYPSQLGFSSDGNVYYRNGVGTTSWKTIIDSSNYTNYVPTKTGSGASGTWGINVTGSAGSVAWGNVSGKPSTYTPSDHAHGQYYDSTISRTANTVLAAPNGSAGGATFRKLVAADIPTLTKSKISDFPSSLPASDVYGWAKAPKKPSYSWSEITSKPSTFTPASHTHSSVNDVNDGAATTFAYSKAGMNYGDYTWLAGWNGKELRAVDKSQFISTQNIGSQSVNYANSSGYAASAGSATNASHLNITNTNEIRMNKPSWSSKSTLWFNWSWTDSQSSLISQYNFADGAGSLTNVAANTFIGSLSGNATSATSATTASKLSTSTAGSSTQPVYFSGGVPTACSYTLGKSVPSNAVFTDTNTWRPLGTTSDTACAGNDSRLSNARPASDVYSWAKASSKPSYSWSEISGKPSSMPASDVYSWAKASSKPSYSWSEISSKPILTTTEFEALF